MNLDTHTRFRDNRVSQHSETPDITPTEIMSDETVAVPTHVDAPAEPELFSRDELKSFDADDIEAGGNICRMLSLFFFYTVIVMGISTWVTYLWVSE